MRKCQFVAAALIFVNIIISQNITYSSGNPLPEEQKAYDVTFYDLNIELFPETRMIKGILTVKAKAVNEMNNFVLDLDNLLTVKKIKNKNTVLPFRHNEGKIWVELENNIKKGELIELSVEYEGKPVSGPKGSFGKFIWAKTDSGDHWIAVNCQSPGADIWFPCKDHPSDKADSVAIHITVPENLKAISNGKLKNVVNNDNQTKTYSWFVSNPLTNYSITLNVAPYGEHLDKYVSVSGDKFDFNFWYLPGNEKPAAKALRKFKRQMRHFEEWLGPYPFRADKYGIVETPYLGMEHQTIIAYGANFKYDVMANFDWGFDALHHHELAHEWFGNMLSPADYKDLWLNEGFASYFQIQYSEDKVGRDNTKKIVDFMNEAVQNNTPVASKDSKRTPEAFLRDIYFKGALVLRTLRFLEGREKFEEIMRKWVYPNSEMENVKDGSQVRYVTTDDFINHVNKITGKDYNWFFDLYVWQEKLPKLIIRRTEHEMELKWESPIDQVLEMPVEVYIGESPGIIEMKNGSVKIEAPKAAPIEVDKRNWILKETQFINE